MSASVFVSPGGYGQAPYPSTPPDNGVPRVVTTPYGNYQSHRPISYSSRTEQKQSKEKSYRNHPCLIAFTVILALALVAAVIALGVILGTDQGGGGGDTVTTTEAPDTGPPSGTVPLLAELLLNDWQYHSELNDPRSALYTAYQEKLCAKAIDSMAQTQQSVRQCTVESFSQGSLRVVFRFYINNPNSNQEGDVRTGTTEILIEVFQNDEDIGNFELTVEVNRCVGNGGCEQACSQETGDDEPTCSCRAGYNLHANGKRCVNIDECDTEPCDQTCVDTDGSFTCDCEDGYILASDGISCQDINECLVDNGGCSSFCNNTDGSFICLCYPGFELGSDGYTCEDIDDCADSPCENGGVCVDLVAGYYCDCQGAGYYGQSCETDVDECMTSAAECSQICINTDGDFRCDCHDGYTLDSDDITCSDIDECSLSPCQNGGLCVNQEGYYLCTCTESYTGDHCQTEYTPDAACDGVVCQNGGSCVSHQGEGICVCAPGFGGLTCQIEPVSCDNGFCSGRGMCSELGPVRRCNCSSGFAGDVCQYDIDECQSPSVVRCQDICINVVGSYDCGCRPGYMLHQDGYSCYAVYTDEPAITVTDAPIPTTPYNYTTTNNCTDYQFTCDNGRCVHGAYICDGDNDCGDYSDEFNCTSGNCDEFTCKDGRCLYQGYVCDGDNDCGDYSDEFNCTARNCSTNFLCQHGGCVYQGVVCDGYNNCDDGSDEFNCTAPNCSTNFLCNNGQCVYQGFVCDGDNDCGDGSDEVNCTARNCNSDDFECDDGQCVYSLDWCNGIVDCNDSSDEHNCTSQCGDDDFTCANYHCVPEAWLCDGDNDCQDYSDELNCACGKAEFTCANYPICVRESQWCDGNPDCPDASDEPMGCSVCVVECAPSQLDCDGRCLSGIYLCDGVADCSDGSDEQGCPCDFRCGDGSCVEWSVVCDRRVDCADGLDETICTEPCNDTMFACDNRCLRNELLCDMEVNCNDGTDETNCDCTPDRDWLGGDAQYLIQTNRTSCDDGVCLYVDQWCNGIVDCRDGSDEQGCVPGCPDGYFRCNSGQCIHSKYRCDILPDCPDYSDEMDNCPCPPALLQNLIDAGVDLNQLGIPPEFQDWATCTDGLCLPSAYFCDGTQSCIDGSDEANCTSNCDDSYEFSCDNGRCVDAGWQCDGDNDCGDLSDERGCTCRSDQNMCDNGVCLGSYHWCDGFNTCVDNSDEKNCAVCGAGFFACADSKCLPVSERCNGENSCGDWSDEYNCTQACDSDEHECYKDGSRLCLPAVNFCDRQRDCQDGSDEASGCGDSCLGDTFSCDGRCFSNRQICDKVQNCADGSDEDDCTCDYNSFHCDVTGVCMSEDRWCDGVLDCFSGSDELSTCHTTCPADYGLCLDNRRCYKPEALCNGYWTCTNFSLPYDCSEYGMDAVTCGRIAEPLRAKKQIYGGSEADPHSYPSQISIHLNGQFNCGGSIIGRNIILTAAHCIETDPNANHYTIMTGKHRIYETDPFEQTHQVRTLIPHPDYNTYTIDHDIALLVLTEPITYSDVAQPVCLSADHPNAGEICIAIGWGHTVDYGYAETLRETFIPIVAQETCKTWYEGINVVTPRMFCAGDEAGTSGTCSGDSGGALLCEVEGSYYLRGVTSWSLEGCKNERAPSVFARVAEFTDWIEENMQAHPVKHKIKG